MPVSRLTVAELDGGRAVLTDVRIGAADDPDVAIERLVLSYDADSLSHERVKHVAVAGVRLAGRWRDGALSFGSLDPLLTADRGGTAGFLPPFESLSLADGEIAVETPWGPIRIPIHGDLRTGGEAALLGQMTARLDVGLKAPDGQTSIAAKGTVVADIDTKERAATLAVETVLGASGEGLNVENARLQGKTRINVADGKIVVSSDDCIGLSLGRATFAANRLSLPAKLCPAAAAKPLLVVETDATDGPVLAFAARLPGARLDGSRLAGVDVAGTTPNLALSGGWQADGWSADIGLDGGDLAVLDGRFGLDGITATVAAKGRAAAAEAQIAIESLTLRDKAATPVVAPLVLSGKATLAGTAARFAAKAIDLGGVVELTAEGRHDIATAAGQMTFRTGRLEFAPDRQPQSLLPLLRGHVTSVAGSLDLAGNAAWKGSTLSSGLTLSYTGGALSTQVAELAGVEAKVTFDSLWPLSTPPGQSLRVGSADVGVPLTDISAIFQVLPDGAVLVERAGWPWAGGVIETRDARLKPGSGRQYLTLEVRDVDVARALNLVDLEGLQGTGRLEGRIPVEVLGATPYIRGGRLSTGPGGGIISYVSESTDATLRNSGAGGELLADALKNFHYTEVVMEMDGETTGPVDVRLHVAGRNPDLYDGYPIELNVNVEGDLGQLMRAGTAGSTDNIRRHIEERRPGEPK